MDITLDITDGVGLIRFDDGKKNAFTLDGIKNLSGAFDEAEANAKAIVLTGRPGSFCAGFDLATMMGDDKEAVRELGQGGGRLALRMYQCGKPLVAACTGHAFTIGCLWLLASDTRIGEDGRFKFSMIETQVGMPLTPWAFTLLEAKLSKRHYTAAVTQSKVYDPRVPSTPASSTRSWARARPPLRPSSWRRNSPSSQPTPTRRTSSRRDEKASR